MSPLNLYNFVTIVSLLFCIPFVFLFEGSTLAAGIQKAIELKGQKEFVIALLKVGAFYHLYNQVAYQAPARLSPSPTPSVTSVSASSSLASPSSPSATRSPCRPPSAPALPSLAPVCTAG